MNHQRTLITLKDITIRNSFRSGDLGWIIQTHGELYQRECGYTIKLEYYVAKSLVEFYESFNPQRSRIWMCEHQGKRIGFLSLVDRGVASQLRYFLIDANYRGIGLGKYLMDSFMDWLWTKNYSSCYLWTTHEQEKATWLYTRHGFELVEEMETETFGKKVRERKYELLVYGIRYPACRL